MSIVHLLFGIILWIIFLVAFPRSVPFEFMVDVLPALLVLAQVVGLGLIILFGLLIGKRVGLGAPLLESWQNGENIRDRGVTILKISSGLGVVVALAKFALDRFLFSHYVPSILIQWKQMPFEWRLLIPFDQGIGDEIALRLFWMTILVWIIYTIQKPENNKPTAIGVWIPILLVTIISIPGILFWAATPLVKLQLTILTALGGIAFGWLYWKKGIESAIIAHFCSSMALVLLSLV